MLWTALCCEIDSALPILHDVFVNRMNHQRSTVHEQFTN